MIVVDVDNLVAMTEAMIHHPSMAALRTPYGDNKEDMIQDALLFVWKQLPKWEPRRYTLQNLVYYAVKNGLRDGLRYGSRPGAFSLKRDGTQRKFAPPPGEQHMPRLDRCNKFGRRHAPFEAFEARDAIAFASRGMDSTTADAVENAIVDEGPGRIVAARRGVSRQQVDNYRRRGLQYMRERLEKAR